MIKHNMSSKPPHFHRMWGKNSLNKIHYCICNRRLCIAGKCHAHNNYKLLLKGLVWNIENTLFLMALFCVHSDSHISRHLRIIIVKPFPKNKILFFWILIWCLVVFLLVAQCHHRGMVFLAFFNF
jgi:hypothetical protein